MPASISAIVPVFNSRALLSDAVASIRAQSRPVDELIVVDDGSSDGSAALAEALGARVLRLPENRGPSAARNVGIRAATGDLVAFLDADDTWTPDHCALLADGLEREPNAALITSRTQHRSPADTHGYAPPDGQAFDALAYLVRDNFVTQSAVIARRSVILEVGGYEETMRFSEDYDLWLKIALRHPLVALRNVTVMRRHHQGQATWKNMSPLFDAAWRLRLALLATPELTRNAMRRAQVIAALEDAVAMDYGLTWRDLDAKSFAIVDAAAAKIPSAARIRASWRLKKALGWFPWVFAVRTRRALRRVMALPRRGDEVTSLT